MPDHALLGPWVRRFLMEHVVGERNLSRNTQSSYRDTLALLIPFAADRAGKPVDQLCVVQVSAPLVRQFLQHLEDSRRCTIATRNQRLAGIHAWAHFVGRNSPEHVDWCGEIRAILFKKSTKPLIPYLEKQEMDALLESPDRSTPQGRRDHALLLFLYNSGARADEAAQLTVAGLDLSAGTPAVTIHGKGNKLRRCPLWSRTVTELKELIAGRASSERVFLNRCGLPITRFGVHTLVERHVRKLSQGMPSLTAKRISPHTIRHTTATHLLRAGVDLNTIRAWLGHVSLDTTLIYAETDLATKAKALAHCEVASPKPHRPWREDAGLLVFLRSL
jgi:site-specific recombinase XerD